MYWAFLLRVFRQTVGASLQNLADGHSSKQSRLGQPVFACCLTMHLDD